MSKKKCKKTLKYLDREISDCFSPKKCGNACCQKCVVKKVSPCSSRCEKCHKREEKRCFSENSFRNNPLCLLSNPCFVNDNVRTALLAANALVNNRPNEFIEFLDPRVITIVSIASGNVPFGGNYVGIPRRSSPDQFPGYLDFVDRFNQSARLLTNSFNEKNVFVDCGAQSVIILFNVLVQYFCGPNGPTSQVFDDQFTYVFTFSVDGEILFISLYFDTSNPAIFFQQCGTSSPTPIMKSFIPKIPAITNVPSDLAITSTLKEQAKKFVDMKSISPKGVSTVGIPLQLASEQGAAAIFGQLRGQLKNIRNNIPHTDLSKRNNFACCAHKNIDTALLQLYALNIIDLPLFFSLSEPDSVAVIHAQSGNVPSAGSYGSDEAFLCFIFRLLQSTRNFESVVYPSVFFNCDYSRIITVDTTYRNYFCVAEQRQQLGTLGPSFVVYTFGENGLIIRGDIYADYSTEALFWQNCPPFNPCPAEPIIPQPILNGVTNPLLPKLKCCDRITSKKTLREPLCEPLSCIERNPCLDNPNFKTALLASQAILNNNVVGFTNLMAPLVITIITDSSGTIPFAGNYKGIPRRTSPDQFPGYLDLVDRLNFYQTVISISLKETNIFTECGSRNVMLAFDAVVQYQCSPEGPKSDYFALELLYILTFNENSQISIISIFFDNSSATLFFQTCPPLQTGIQGNPSRVLPNPNGLLPRQTSSKGCKNDFGCCAHKNIDNVILELTSFVVGDLNTLFTLVDPGFKIIVHAQSGNFPVAGTFIGRPGLFCFIQKLLTTGPNFASQTFPSVLFNCDYSRIVIIIAEHRNYFCPGTGEFELGRTLPSYLIYTLNDKGLVTQIDVYEEHSTETLFFANCPPLPPCPPPQ